MNKDERRDIISKIDSDRSKRRFIALAQAIPDDLFEAAYVVDLRQGYRVQCRYASELAQKYLYKSAVMNAEIDEHGYVSGFLDLPDPDYEDRSLMLEIVLT